MGLSRREFAKSEQCTEGAVRYALKKGRLVARPDGTLDATQLGGSWMRNLQAATKRRVKREVDGAQNVRVTQPPAQIIPLDVSAFYGWNDPEYHPEAEEGFGLVLGLKEEYRRDPESIGISMMLHGVSVLQREAYRLGWRENGPKPPRADADPLGPEAALTDLTDQPLNFGLVRKFGRAMQLDLPDVPAIDVDDPVVVAHLMVFVASDILQEEMKRRRREAGLISPRDQSAAS